MRNIRSSEYKASIVTRLLPLNNVSVTELVRETGIPEDTLYGWRSKACEQGLEAAQASGPTAALSSEDETKQEAA